MLFKNAQVYTFSTMPDLTEEAIATKEFAPCGALDPKRVGFVKPLGFDSLVGRAGEFSIVCMNVEEKILPPSVVNKFLADKIEEINGDEGRPVGRKERQTLKDEIVFSLMPRAFTKHSRTCAIIDHRNHLLIVDASSASKAEDVCSLLREALGSLGAVPIHIAQNVSQTLTTWLAHDMPAELSAGEYCKLVESSRLGAIHTARNEDLFGEEIRKLLDNGRVVTELGMTYDNGLGFVLTESLSFKQLKFADELVDERLEGAESAFEVAQANLTLCGGMLRALVLHVVAELEGTQSLGLEADEPSLSVRVLPDQAEVDRALDEALRTEDIAYPDAVAFIRKSRKASISALQRNLRVGYNRAARMIEQMEQDGVVSAMDDKGARQVLEVEEGE